VSEPSNRRYLTEDDPQFSTRIRLMTPPPRPGSR
jgi:hypothetical protein